MFFDPYYLLFVGPFMLIAAWASARVKSTFRHYAKVGVRSGMTGAQAAAAVARAGGAEVKIERLATKQDRRVGHRLHTPGDPHLGPAGNDRIVDRHDG